MNFDILYSQTKRGFELKFLFLLFFVFLADGINGFSQPYHLKYNLQQGKEYRYYQETNMVITQTLSGHDQKVKNNFKGITRFKLIKREKDNFVLNVCFETMAIHIENDMFTVDYDSSLPIEDGNLMAQVYQRVLGKDFLLTINQYGTVLNIEGIDEIIDEAANDIPDLSEKQRMEVKNALVGHIGKETLTGNMQMLLAIYPDEDKMVGDHWSTSTHLNSVVKAKLNNDWTFLDDKQDEWVFNAKGTIATTGEKSKMNGVDVGFKLTGNQDSKIVMSQKDGWFENASQEQSIEGVIVLENQTQDSKVLEIPMKVLTSTKLERR